IAVVETKPWPQAVVLVREADFTVRALNRPPALQRIALAGLVVFEVPDPLGAQAGEGVARATADVIGAAPSGDVDVSDPNRVGIDARHGCPQGGDVTDVILLQLRALLDVLRARGAPCEEKNDKPCRARNQRGEQGGRAPRHLHTPDALVLGPCGPRASWAK